MARQLSPTMIRVPMNVAIKSVSKIVKQDIFLLYPKVIE
jgi:hypothetical protein